MDCVFHFTKSERLEWFDKLLKMQAKVMVFLKVVNRVARRRKPDSSTQFSRLVN